MGSLVRLGCTPDVAALAGVALGADSGVGHYRIHLAVVADYIRLVVAVGIVRYFAAHIAVVAGFAADSG